MLLADELHLESAKVPSAPLSQAGFELLHDERVVQHGALRRNTTKSDPVVDPFIETTRNPTYFFGNPDLAVFGRVTTLPGSDFVGSRPSFVASRHRPRSITLDSPSRAGRSYGQARALWRLVLFAEGRSEARRGERDPGIFGFGGFGSRERAIRCPESQSKSE